MEDYNATTKIDSWLLSAHLLHKIEHEQTKNNINSLTVAMLCYPYGAEYYEGSFQRRHKARHIHITD